MTRLKDPVLQAHGRLDRWRQFDRVSADLVQAGVLWPLKGHPDTLSRTNVRWRSRMRWRRTRHSLGRRKAA